MIFYEPGHHAPHGFRHDPFKACIVPRPICWISTVDSEGRGNLAPYSFFNAVSVSPPVLVFGTATKADGSPKDSQRNIEETGEFACSLVTEALQERMNATAAHLPHGEDEMIAAELLGASCRKIRPRRVASAPIALECRYLQTVKLPTLHPPAGN
jgi:flavin reductase (DIM6/NTAB) family NADH-FMN oxidoreductase RutF